MKSNGFTTENRQSFELPNKIPKPTWRERDSSLTFDKSPSSRFNEKSESKINSSGFALNSTLFDGTGWVPEKNMHADQLRTIYRNYFN
mmetsp:Transcript_28000/g.20960  ORF Transcript_28000/g.20960 Transcript_28000/m.20960 type:complete len:88 (+) Transcript_28000:154-417(+)